MKWSDERAILKRYGMTRNMLVTVKENIQESTFNILEMLVIEMRPMCDAITALSNNNIKLADIVYIWNSVYAKLDEAIHSSSAHVREGIADEVYLFYESALNKKCRNHIEYDLDEPEEASKCGVKYVATVKG